MRRFDRFPWVIGGACVAGAALVLLWPVPKPQAAWVAPPLPIPVFDPERRLAEDHDVRIDAMRRKIVLKEALLADLVDGRRSLAAAVTDYLAIEDRWPALAVVHL